MTVPYESTVREMDAEELEAEYKRLNQLVETGTLGLLDLWGIANDVAFIEREYQQLTGKPLTNGHLPTVL